MKNEDDGVVAPDVAEAGCEDDDAAAICGDAGAPCKEGIGVAAVDSGRGAAGGRPSSSSSAYVSSSRPRSSALWVPVDCGLSEDVTAPVDHFEYLLANRFSTIPKTRMDKGKDDPRHAGAASGRSRKTNEQGNCLENGVATYGDSLPKPQRSLFERKAIAVPEHVGLCHQSH